ncbi:MAG: hypothetical protein ABIP79_00860 [Chitinophagaceae bacterium]
MLKNVHFVVVAAVIVCFTAISVACTQKTAPVITSRSTEPFKKEKQAISILPDLNEGKIVFTNRCGKCHDLPLPDQFTEKRWEGILSYMIPRARLNEEQGIHVTAYLKANAKK